MLILKLEFKIENLYTVFVHTTTKNVSDLCLKENK